LLHISSCNTVRLELRWHDVTIEKCHC